MDDMKVYRSLVENLAQANPDLTREEFDELFKNNISDEKYQAFRNILDKLWELYCELRKLF